MTDEDTDTLRIGNRILRFANLTAIEHRALVGVALAVFFARLNDRPVLLVGMELPPDLRAAARRMLRFFRECAEVRWVDRRR